MQGWIRDGQHQLQLRRMLHIFCAAIHSVLIKWLTEHALCHKGQQEQWSSGIYGNTSQLGKAQDARSHEPQMRASHQSMREVSAEKWLLHHKMSHHLNYESASWRWNWQLHGKMERQQQKDNWKADNTPRVVKTQLKVKLTIMKSVPGCVQWKFECGMQKGQGQALPTL